jgi:hypothetical protein
MDCFIGEIKLFPFTFVPQGFRKCDGSTLSINQNQALFSLIGSGQWPVNYSNNQFTLPKLDAPPGMMYCIALEGMYPSRD